MPETPTAYRQVGTLTTMIAGHADANAVLGQRAVDLYECRRCGATVSDREAHTAFHVTLLSTRP